MPRTAWLPVLLTLAAGAQAQTPPPIKPGLWSIRSERELDGQKVPDPTERLKTLPPQARAQMEAMMKQRGVDMGSGGDIRICHTKETLASRDWQQAAPAQCKTEITSQTAQRWAWKSVCAAPMSSTSEGETVFQSPEAYTVTMKTVSERSGKAQTLTMHSTAKWAGADCGEVKPILAPK